MNTVERLQNAIGGLLKTPTHEILAAMNWMWIKKNQTFLTVVAVLVVLAAGGVPLWLYKCEQRDLAASMAYSNALKILKKEDPENFKQAREALDKVVAEYSKSKVAGLAELYAAHLSVKLGELEKAQKAYESFLAKASPKDPLRPLALSALKTTYETLKQPEKVKELDAELQKFGFFEK